MVTLVCTRFGMEFSRTFPTLRAAAAAAVADIETNAAWPCRILDAEGILLWEHVGPLTESTTELRLLATEAGWV
jgi:hypothetical protein